MIVSTAAAVPPVALAVTPVTPKPGPVPTTQGQPSKLPTLDDGYGPTPQQSAAMTAAAAKARATGKPVTVDSLTTETAQYVAQPKGGFVLTGTPEPVRANQNGKWVPVDTTLHRNADGSLSPAATAYGSVTLSGGGKVPLAVTASGSTTYSVSWPAALPTPTVAGSTATYHDVLPGVDLQASATIAGGFSEVLVVHDKQAASNPALAKLQLPTVVAGGSVKTEKTGGVTITGAKGGNTLTASTPFMWDSNTTIPSAAKDSPRQRSSVQTSPDASDSTHPGAVARSAPIKAEATASALTLVPDKHLLTDTATVFPLYIDPSFQWKNPTENMSNPSFDEVKQGYPCTNTSFYNDTSSGADNGYLAVGINDFAGGTCLGKMRAYFQWALPQEIWGAHIGNVSGQPGATANFTKVYSGTCATGNINLHWSGGIGPGTSWNNQPNPGPSIGQLAWGPVDRPCGAGTPAAITHGYDVTSVIAQSAAAHASQITLGLLDDGGEASRSDAAYARFAHNATLQIFFNRAPNTPGADGMAAKSGADNAGCNTAGQGPYPYMGKAIATNTPVLSTTVSDVDGDHLQADFQYWVDNGSPTDGYSADNVGSGGTAAYSLPSSFITGLSNGQVVSWKARVTDGEDWGGWSPVCHFTAEPTAPSAPSISSTDGRYPDNGTIGAVAGTPGRFTVASTGGQVSKLVDSLDEPNLPRTNPPSADVMTPNGSAAIAVASRWKLSDATATAAPDSAGNAPATLSGTTSFVTDPVHGKVMSLNGNGFAATSGPVIKTDGSFTVSAWVNAASTTDSGAVLGQDSVFASGFYLENIDGKWSFSKLSSDNLNAAAVRAESTNAPQVGVWAHLAGVYDASNGKLTLYVNGQAQGTNTDSTPYAANGPFTIGRAQWNAMQAGDFKGSISDVQAYQAALSATDIAKIFGGGQISPAARWRMTEGTGTSLADASGNNHPVTLTGGGVAWAPATDDAPALRFAGPDGHGATSGPVLDTTQSFTVSAWAKISDLNGYYAVASQNATHTSAFEIRYSPDVKAWIFGMTNADATGDPYQWAFLSNTVTQANVNVWTHVAGVYDAPAHQISLYVNGVLIKQNTVSAVIPAPGPFVVGDTRFNDGDTAFFHGSISDVQAYQTALNGSEIAEMAASATRSYGPKSPGPHTMLAYTADAAGDASGYQSYTFYSGADPSTTCATLAACFNNVSISPNNNVSLGNADGLNSFSADDLTNAGWNSGGTVNVNGAKFTLPQFGAGQADNVLAANQTITVGQSVATTGSSALEFLTTGTTVDAGKMPPSIKGNLTAPYVPAGTPVTASWCFDSTKPGYWCAPKGVIHYDHGFDMPYYLTVPDWVAGPSALAAVTLPHRNEPGGPNGQLPTKLYTFSVPLIPGRTVQSVTLPDVGASPWSAQALHIYGMATRDTTIDGAAAGKTWTGAWSSPTEGLFNYGSTFSDVTFREAVRPSIGGDTVRIKFDNAMGDTPLDIRHASIALASGGGTAPTAVPAASPIALTFGGQPNVTLPEGGMTYSDPIHLTVPANKFALVSFQVGNDVPYIVTNSETNNTGYGFVTANATATEKANHTDDHTMDMTGTAFSHSGTDGFSTNVVTNMDVQTSGVPTQAVLGDGFVEQTQPGRTAVADLADVFAATEATTPTPYGTLSEGIQSNRVMTDYASVSGGGPSLLSRIDRDLLDQPGLNTVVLEEGLQDVLAGRSANDLTSSGLSALIDYLTGYGLTFVGMGLTPCLGYAGNGTSTNDACTTAVDDQRVAVNQWLAEFGGQPSQYYVDSDKAVGVPDSSGQRVQLNPAADSGDHVNLNDAGFGALASVYQGAQDTWTLDDGATTSDPTIAADTPNSGTSPYLPASGGNQATLAGTAAWAADPVVAEALSLDGSAGYAATDGPAVDTSRSFSVSVWANLSTLPSTAATVLGEDGQHSSAFYLFYNPASKSWNFSVSPSDTPTVANLPCVIAPDQAAANTWTHLVGVYDAVAKTESLYVNGTFVNLVGNVTSFAATGPFTMGRARWNDANDRFFPGRIRQAQAWNYALTPTQVSALYQRIN
ncbi:LamG-like jellyroll fold domain-containing protein [Kutzneria chonburiensis]|uniref:LamG-like jellyroll fold domain-containing protein n=1 Tax=Kutzneria chonburiensis TaxID=1483604 RepID=A0ABV6N4Q7_9PSEU|nr:LamG-like jellyroll fold domain-containing protein [Kutzneria chonburiensis]